MTRGRKNRYWSYEEATDFSSMRVLSGGACGRMVFHTRLVPFTPEDARSRELEKGAYVDLVMEMRTRYQDELRLGIKWLRKYIDELKKSIDWDETSTSVRTDSNGIRTNVLIGGATKNRRLQPENRRNKPILGGTMRVNEAGTGYESIRDMSSKERRDAIDDLNTQLKYVTMFEKKIEKLISRGDTISRAIRFRLSWFEKNHGDLREADLANIEGKAEYEELSKKYLAMHGHEYRRFTLMRIGHETYMPRMWTLAEKIHATAQKYGLEGVSDAICVAEYNRLRTQVRHEQERRMK